MIVELCFEGWGSFPDVEACDENNQSYKRAQDISGMVSSSHGWGLEGSMVMVVVRQGQIWLEKEKKASTWRAWHIGMRLYPTEKEKTAETFQTKSPTVYDHKISWSSRVCPDLSHGLNGLMQCWCIKQGDIYTHLTRIRKHESERMSTRFPLDIKFSGKSHYLSCRCWRSSR